MSDEVALARSGLLDALAALEAHLDAIVVVGAQAIYLHTGSTQVALAEFTIDGDVAFDPGLLSDSPLIEDAMRAANFRPDPNPSSVGTWVSTTGVPVDLMVPDGVAGTGRRSASLPPHSSRSMRRARGLEATLVDNGKMVISSFDEEIDPRAFEVSVAGPTALLVAKLHKIRDRVENPARLDNKDAHDVYRLLRGIETEVFADGVARLTEDAVSAGVTREAIGHLRVLFAAGPKAKGSEMAGSAEELVGDPVTVAESVALLAQDLLDMLEP